MSSGNDDFRSCVSVSEASYHIKRCNNRTDVPGKFKKDVKTAITREIKLYENMLKYQAKQTVKDVILWKTPLVSAYLFCGWMYFVMTNSIRLTPAWLVSMLFIFMMRQYFEYHVNSPASKVFGYKSIWHMTKLLVGGPHEQKMEADASLGRRSSFDSDATPLTHGNGQNSSPPRTQQSRKQTFLQRQASSFDDWLNGPPMADSDKWKFQDHADFPFSIGSMYYKLSSKDAAAKPICKVIMFCVRFVAWLCTHYPHYFFCGDHHL